MSARRMRGAGLVRHGRLRSAHPVRAVLSVIAVAMSVVLVSAVSVAAIEVAQLRGQITTVALAGESDSTVAAPPTLGSFEGGFNILIVGSDQCERVGGCKERQGVLNDVTMLLHVGADQKSAVAVSIPRDLVVPVPACPRQNGKGNYASMSAVPINSTLGYGGLACTVLTVEKLTGLDIPYAGLITFNGVIAMSTAVGGVPVCVNGPIKDRFTGLNLPAAGTYTLEGAQALAFLRTRHGVGDGSDLGRISSQQVFLSSLVRTIKSDSTLTNIPRLFSIATAATSNMSLSNSLVNLNTMVSMSLVLKDVPLEKIIFVQYPGTTGEGGVYAGKVAPIKAQADALFSRILNDESFELDSGTGLGSVAAPSVTPSASPTGAPASSAPKPAGTVGPSASAPATDVLAGVLGQTAAEYTCSKANN